jgi:hypothetical protein
MTNKRFLTELARWYGNEKGAVGPPDDTSKFQTAELKGGKQSPLGYGPPLFSGSSFKMLDWAQRECNKTAWKEIMEASGKFLSMLRRSRHARCHDVSMLERDVCNDPPPFLRHFFCRF